jgi:Asp-tRNA(Asn)/Glu-tRNA(Gln) amidotransferase A subunit family amidase
MSDPIRRRTFGQMLGAAALGGAVPPPRAGSDDPCSLTAGELVARIRARQVSARDVMAAHLARIELVNPTQVAGTPMVTHIDWMRACWYVTFMATPAISVPGGFTTAGLPVGLQIVGRHRDDWSLLQMAHAFERAAGHGARRPAIRSMS